ncbi:MAG: DUF4340 domain-containing protein [Bacillota bacterium]|jgi:hypothetical protein
MTNRKQKRQLLVMLIILATVAVAFFGTTVLNKYLEHKEEAETISISSISSIKQISYNNGSESLSFALDENNDWYYTENPNFPLQTSYIENLAETIRGLTALREISADQSDELAAYGLDVPQATVTVSGNGKQTDNILIGNANKNGYYLKLSDSNTIYLVDAQLIEAISLSLYDMAEIEDIPAFDTDKLTSIQINNTIIKVQTENADEKNENSVSQTENKWYCGETDVSDYSQISALTYNLPYLAFSGMAAWNPSSEQLYEFGFDNPIKAVFNYTESDGAEKSYTLLIGSSAGDSEYYTMLPGSSSIYRIGTTDISAIVSIAEKGLSPTVSLTEDSDYGYTADSSDIVEDYSNLLQ